MEGWVTCRRDLRRTSPESAGAAPPPRTTSPTWPSRCSWHAASTRSASTTSPQRPASHGAPCFATTAPRTPSRGGNFDAHLQQLRELLATLSPAVPLGDALRQALLAFNTYGAAETEAHRQRMRVILETTGLQAYSMTMYAGWREVIATYVARRTGTKTTDLVPQTAAWLMLGVALSAYEHWLADESASLTAAIADAFDIARPGLDALDPR